MEIHKISLEKFVKLTDVEMMGMKDGIWEVYDEKGNLNTVCKIIDGVENGVWKVFYENGKLEICGNYINGERDGVWKYYNMDGSIRMIIPYINGKVSRNYLNNDDGDNPKRTIHQMDNLLVEKIHIFLIQESIHWNEEKEGISFNEYIQISPLMNELMKRLSEWENKYGFCISTKFHLI